MLQLEHVPSRNSLADATLARLEPSWREFRREQTKTSKTWEIAIEPDGESYRVRQGTLGGELTIGEAKRPGAHGKPGSRTFLSAADACNREVERLVRMQMQKGFIEFENGHPVAHSTAIDFSRPFPADLLTPKPRSSIAPAELKKLHDLERLVYTRKYDGIGVTLVRHTYGWEVYTLSNNCISDHFTTQIRALEKTRFKVGTVLKAEAVIFKSEDPMREDFNLINARFGPTRNPLTTRAMIASGEIPEPSFVIYDILYFNGKELHDTAYEDRSRFWKGLPVARGGNGPLLSAEYFPQITPDNWMEKRNELALEGWVANDKQAVLGKNALSYAQSPARPAGIYKLKPNTQEDVVVFAVRKVNGAYESVFTKQRYPDYYPDTNIPVPDAGKWFYCGRVSLHRSPIVSAEIDKLAKAGQIQVVADNKQGESLPLQNGKGVTVVVEFFERQAQGKFRHAKFPEELRIRARGSGDYKAPSQCFAQTLVLPE